MRMAVAAAVTILASGAFAQTPEAGRVAKLIAVIEDFGCVVNEYNEDAILANAGMTEGQGGEIVMLLMSEGRAVPQNDDLRLVTGKCN